jgi:hypothetical protein
MKRESMALLYLAEKNCALVERVCSPSLPSKSPYQDHDINSQSPLTAQCPQDMVVTMRTDGRTPWSLLRNFCVSFLKWAVEKIKCTKCSVHARLVQETCIVSVFKGTEMSLWSFYSWGN